MPLDSRGHVTQTIIVISQDAILAASVIGVTRNGARRCSCTS